MSYDDTPNSTKDVVTSIGHVMFEFKQLIADEMNSISTVFDPQLSYETAMKKWLKENPQHEDPIPLFAYNRTIPNYGEVGLMRRGRGVTGVLKLEDENGNKIGASTYSVMHGEFTINFMYVTQSMEEAERFEVAYYGDEGISKTTEIIVEMPKLGAFSYFLDYNELDDITIEKDGSYYKTLIGTVKVRGMYFTFKGQSDLIKELNARIISSNNIPQKEENEVLANILID